MTTGSFSFVFRKFLFGLRAKKKCLIICFTYPLLYARRWVLFPVTQRKPTQGCYCTSECKLLYWWYNGQKRSHLPIFWLKILSNVSSSLSSRYFCITLRMLQTQGDGGEKWINSRHCYQTTEADTTRAKLRGYASLLPGLLFVILALVWASPCHLSPSSRAAGRAKHTGGLQGSRERNTLPWEQVIMRMRLGRINQLAHPTRPINTTAASTVHQRTEARLHLQGFTHKRRPCNSLAQPCVQKVPILHIFGVGGT